MIDTAPLLSVRDLSVRLRTAAGSVPLVEGLDFDLARGETLGLVGESGCGKSVSARSLLRLLPTDQFEVEEGSRVLLEGRDLLAMREPELRRVRGGRVAMAFQEPASALNPVVSVGAQIEEVLALHTSLDRLMRRNRSIELLERVGLADPVRRAREYPHQMSGGMRQRAMLAMALGGEPELLIADEPTTALDRTTQVQILALLRELQHQTGVAILMISHDLGVVAQLCARVMVMYAGQIVECAPTAELFTAPRHPYTRALLDARPTPGPHPRGARLPELPGQVPPPGRRPEGCRFHDRCLRAVDACREPSLRLEDVGGRRWRCRDPLEGTGS